MSRGKYSPWCYSNNNRSNTVYTFNCYGEVPVEWDKENYNEKTMLENYDFQGFDCYGYSAFDAEGNYIGVGQGIDRYGYTENEYLCMSDDKFEDINSYATELIEFKRNRDVMKAKTRKTKAQKRAEAELEIKNARVREWEEFKADYPVKFTALMFDFFRFGNTDYNLSITRYADQDDVYEFCWGAGWNRKSVYLKPVPPVEYDWEYEQAFRNAESAIQEERDRLAEAERKQLLRQSALNKLSDEEKAVLGLK